MLEYAPNGRQRWAVTGASGFVGRRLVEWFATHGIEAIALSRKTAVRSASGKIVALDYKDSASLASVLTEVDALVHLAARAHQFKAAANDLDAFRASNVDLISTVTRACHQMNIRRMVLISSIGIHGSRTNGQAVTESDAAKPIEPYAVSKWEGEEAAAEALAGSATELVVLRPPLVYGPGAPGNFGQLLGLVRRLPLVPLGGLHRQRSLIHIDNLCSAIEVACSHPGIAGQRFVLCDGDDVSVAEIARELAIGFGRSPRCVVNVPEGLLRAAASLLGRSAAVAKLADELRVDASAFRTATGWVPPRRAREALRETAAASTQRAGAARDA